MRRTKEIDGEWAGSNFLVFSKGPLTSPTLQGSSYTPPATPNRKLTKIFHQELAFYLLEVSCPIFYFVLKPISINKECVEVQNIKHKLGCYQKKIKSSLPTRYSTCLVTCIIFLVQGPSQYQPRCWMGHPGKINLPYLTEAETQTRKPGYVTCHVQNSGKRSL